MPWYRFTSKHGPGHMGHSKCYRFEDRKLNPEELRETWEDVFREYDNCIGDAVIVRKLPIGVAISKKLNFIWLIEDSVKTLKSRFGIDVKVKFPKGLVEDLRAERTRIHTAENTKHRRKMERLAAAAKRRT